MEPIENQVGAPGTDTSEPTEPVAIPKEGEPQGGVVQDTPIDPRYAGKSPSELVDIIREKESMVGRLGEEKGKISSLESELANLRDLVFRQYQYQQEMARQPEPQRPPEEYDPVNPQAYFEKRLEAERNRLYGEFRNVQQKQVMDEISANFNIGRQKAAAMYPELMKGIENDIAQNLWNTALQSPVTRWQLSQPETWETAARMYRAYRKEYEYFVPKSGGTMKPVATELPGRTAKPIPDDEDVTLSDEERLQAREDGLDEKEALEAKRMGIEMQRRGQLRGSTVRNR